MEIKLLQKEIETNPHRYARKENSFCLGKSGRDSHTPFLRYYPLNVFMKFPPPLTYPFWLLKGHPRVQYSTLKSLYSKYSSSIVPVDTGAITLVRYSFLFLTSLIPISNTRVKCFFHLEKCGLLYIADECSYFEPCSFSGEYFLRPFLFFCVNLKAMIHLHCNIFLEG